MVSFCCDNCQEVITKPKVQRHLLRCRNSKVSCLDCQQTFDLRTVGSHNSCISEAEKYGPKYASARSRETYCSLCELELNNAVHAEQHYASKKHRAAIRRSKGTKKTSKSDVISDTVNSCQDACKSDHQHREQGKIVNDVNVCANHFENRADRVATKKEKRSEEAEVIRCETNMSKGNTKSMHTNDVGAIKRIMKEMLQKSKRQRMRPEALAHAVRSQLGNVAPDDLDAKVLRRAHGSKRFHVGKRRIHLVNTNVTHDEKNVFTDQ